MNGKGNVSRPVLLGVFAIWPGYIVWLLLSATLLVIGAAFDAGGNVPGWVVPVWVVLLTLLQVLAVVGSVALYWAPRLRDLRLDDGTRQEPTAFGMLIVIAAVPVLTMLGIARGAEDVPGWLYLLAGACLVVVVPAMLDHLVRQSIVDRKARRG